MEMEIKSSIAYNVYAKKYQFPPYEIQPPQG